MADYRPISFCNSIYKIISKLMVNRLKPTLMKIISPEQHGFTPGHEITYSIIMVAKTIHTMHNSKPKGMIIKLDVSKAYNRVSWNFLFEVLKKIGFKVVGLYKTLCFFRKLLCDCQRDCLWFFLGY